MITIIDYGAGNLTSVKRALDYLNIPSVISADPSTILKSERIIFPGVGNAESATETLRATGIDRALSSAVARGTPTMGICLGTQIILDSSEEGSSTCLGLIPGRCVQFRLADKSLKIPHMGWNDITIARSHYVLKDVRPEDEFYFVHSYYPQPSNARHVIATCSYEIDFPAAIGMDNIFATQFHPEKSGPAGLTLLKNFAEWDGSSC